MSERNLAATQKQAATRVTPSISGFLQRKCACGNHTVAGGTCEGCGKMKYSLQRKLTIGASNDPLEQQADRVADQVMAAPAHTTIGLLLSRIQRYAGSSAGGGDVAPTSVERALASPGMSLQPDVREDMEQRFGRDFTRVRVHSDAAAEQSARDVNANAYTVGHDMAFDVGRFAPGTQDGRRLIAHELTHVVQQSSVDGSRVELGGAAIVQRDEADEERKRKAILGDFPPLSPEVAASYGMPRPPPGAASIEGPKSHATPPGLGPKSQPRTPKEEIAAANVTPHHADASAKKAAEGRLEYKYHMSAYSPSTAIGHFDEVEFNSETQILTITIRPEFHFPEFNVRDYASIRDDLEAQKKVKQDLELKKQAFIHSFVQQAEGWGGHHVFFCHEPGLEALRAGVRVEVDLDNEGPTSSPSITPVIVKDENIRPHAFHGSSMTVPLQEGFELQYDAKQNRMITKPIGPPIDLRQVGEYGSAPGAIVGLAGLSETRPAKPPEQLTFAHEIGHIFGLGDEYIEEGKQSYARGRPTEHSALAKAILGKNVTHGDDKNSIMASGNEIRPEHGVTFLEALQKVTKMRWGFEAASERQRLQRKATDGTSIKSVPPIVNEVLASPGQPLDASTRGFMEERFGHKFSAVRSHTDRRAAESADAVNALAYTVGQHIVFASGAYAPGTQQGDALLAHELAHVRQQAEAWPGPLIEMQPTHADAERGAERAADRVTQGEKAGAIGGTSYGLYRAPAPGAPPRTIPSGRRVIIQWGDDYATVVNTEALRTGARSGPNAAGADQVLHYTELTPDSLADAREVIIVIHGETELTAEGGRVVELESGQPKATHGAPGLGKGVFTEGKAVQGPIEAVSPEAMAKRLVGAGFGKGRWTNYRVRLAMCYAGVGKAESYSARLSQAVALLGVSNETIGYRGAVTAVGGEPIGTQQPSFTGKKTESGKPVAANFYPAEEGTSVGAPGTRMRRDVSKPPAAAGSATTAAKAPTPAPNLGGGAIKPPTLLAPPAVGAKSVGAVGSAIAGEIAVGVLVAFAEAAVIAGIALIADFIKEWLEQMLIERDMEALRPQIEGELAKLAPQISALQSHGKVFARITLDAIRQEGQTTEGGMLTLWERYIGIFPVSVEVEADERPPARSEFENKAERSLGSLKTHRLLSYSVLLDDPAKRARQKQQAELLERMRRSAASAPKQAPPASSKPQPLQEAPPLLAPPGIAPSPKIDFLQGAPPPSKGPEPMAVVAWLRGQMAGLLQTGEKLVGLPGQTRADIDAFGDAEENWRVRATYEFNNFTDNGPDMARGEMDNILHGDRQGGRLIIIRRNLGLSEGLGAVPSR